MSSGQSPLASTRSPSKPGGPWQGQPSKPLGVVVVHYGDPSPTLACLKSLLEDPSEVERRIVVVDNSAAKAPLSLAPAQKQTQERVEILRCPDNPGFGAGANRGTEILFRSGQGAAAFAGLVVLNHDVVLAPGYLDAAARAISAPGVGAAAGPIHQGSFEGPLWYAGGGVRYLTGTVTQSSRAEDARKRRRVTFLPGAALAFNTDAWLETGGFDPRIFLYNEDLDLCLRLSRAGWALVFEPSMTTAHDLGSATGSGSLSPLYLRHLTATRFLPFRSTAYRLYLALVHTGWVALRSALLLRHPTPGPAIRALLHGHWEALATVFRRPSSAGSVDG